MLTGVSYIGGLCQLQGSESKKTDRCQFNKTPSTLSSSSSSRLQAISLFEAYWLGTSILGKIQIAVGHHCDFEVVFVTGTLTPVACVKGTAC